MNIFTIIVFKKGKRIVHQSSQDLSMGAGKLDRIYGIVKYQIDYQINLKFGFRARLHTLISILSYTGLPVPVGTRG